MLELLNNIWQVYLDTAVWLLLGLVAAGLVKVYIPEQAMHRWLGGRGFSAVGRAALFGAPLPLCSCGVLPVALGLRRAGASKEATVSFLISTPETSIDSVTVTYALMGPVMAVYRPLAAIMSAMLTGVLVAFIKDAEPSGQARSSGGKAVSACCDVGDNAADSCCNIEPVKATNRLKQAVHYAGSELLDDISKWLAFGIIFAGVMVTVVPEGWLAQWGQGVMAMLVMLVVGIPMYICAVASTPVAAGLLLAGVSPGAVLVFLLVGPATNIAGLMLIRQELGGRVTLVYLAGIALVSIAMGVLLDFLLGYFGLQLKSSMQQQYNFLPYEVSLLSGVVLLLLVVPAIRNRLIPFFASRR